MKDDAIIIGGGFAGLAAATYLARDRRKVCVIDTGRPRNRFASASHGFLGQDGKNPSRILATAREQLLAYGAVQLKEDGATAAHIRGDGFAVLLASGETVVGNKLILAFGLSDELPDIPGLSERWGETALHCPYCHGIEFADRELGVLYRTPMSVHQACLITEWGPTTLYLNGASLNKAEAPKPADRGVKIRTPKVVRLVGDGPALSAIELEDGHNSALAALYISPLSRLTSPLAAQLGVEIDDGPLVPMIRAGADRTTSVAGVYAAGDIARTPQSVSWAVLDLERRILGPLQQRVELHRGYIDAAPTGPYDGATCLLTLHFLEGGERLRVLQEIRLRLKPGAPLIVAHHSCPDGGEIRRWLSRSAAFASEANVNFAAAALPVSAMASRLPILSVDQDEAILREAGFSDVALFYVGFTFHGWVAAACCRQRPAKVGGLTQAISTQSYRRSATNQFARRSD